MEAGAIALITNERSALENFKVPGHFCTHPRPLFEACPHLEIDAPRLSKAPPALKTGMGLLLRKSGPAFTYGAPARLRSNNESDTR